MFAQHRQPQANKRPAYALVLWPFLILVMLLALGCSVNKSNYKTLSFFFDGVPDPSAPIMASSASSNGPAAAGDVKPVKLFQHKPYSDGKCTECHTADKKQLVTVKAELCLKCHQPTIDQYPTMHGPVAVGECLWCHEPHESDSPRLLKTSAPELCLQCHDQSLLPADIKPHQSDQANCLECHTGHGGSKPSMLLVDNPNVAPITARLLPSALGPTTKPDPTTNPAPTPTIAPDAGGAP
jgi:predicted CXXCH cytochrome family protein